MRRQCVINGTTCPCVRGVQSNDLLMFLKRYHSGLTDWIKDLESGNSKEDDFVWIETGLLEQLVELYMNVKVVWDKELQKHRAVE